MKTTWTLLVFLLSITIVYGQGKKESNRIVKVLTFNILHGATTQGDFNLDVIAQVIKDVDPDVVAMQEVDFKTQRAKNYDLPTELAIRTGLAPLFGKAMSYDGGEYGEAILSRYSFIKTENHPLPCSPGNEPRAALAVFFALPSGDSICFIGTHLDHTNVEHDRILQAKKINQLFSESKYPCIMAGDLNATPESETIQILEELWTPSYDPQNLQFTYPSDCPEHKIDYIMFYPEHKWRIIETEVICDTIASDHCAYLVSLQLIHE